MIVIDLEPQEALNKVYCELVKQGGPSEFLDTNGNRRCVYRYDAEHKKCAVGCIINDEDYVSELEGKTVGSLICEMKMSFTNDITYKLCSRLQSIHDDYSGSTKVPIQSWTDYISKEFDLVAKEFGLERPYV